MTACYVGVSHTVFNLRSMSHSSTVLRTWYYLEWHHSTEVRECIRRNSEKLKSCGTHIFRVFSEDCPQLRATVRRYVSIGRLFEQIELRILSQYYDFIGRKYLIVRLTKDMLTIEKMVNGTTDFCFSLLVVGNIDGAPHSSALYHHFERLSLWNWEDTVIDRRAALWVLDRGDNRSVLRVFFFGRCWSPLRLMIDDWRLIDFIVTFSLCQSWANVAKYSAFAEEAKKGSLLLGLMVTITVLLALPSKSHLIFCLFRLIDLVLNFSDWEQNARSF